MRGSWRGEVRKARGGRRNEEKSEMERKGAHGGVRRVGEIYLPAACADKIIRQKTGGGRREAGRRERAGERARGDE